MRLFRVRCSSTPTQVQLSRAGLSAPLVPSPSPHGTPSEEAPLVRGLMLQLGETLSVWSRLAVAGALAVAGDGGGGGGGRSRSFPAGFASKESLTSGEEAFALSTAHVGLLRALLARDGWSVPLANCLREVREREAGRERKKETEREKQSVCERGWVNCPCMSPPSLFFVCALL